MKSKIPLINSKTFLKKFVVLEITSTSTSAVVPEIGSDNVSDVIP